MKKYEIAQYLVNLHSLLEAQAANGLEKSTSIAIEYETVWGELKKEIEDEARTRDEPNGRHETGADLTQGERGGGEPTRRS